MTSPTATSAGPSASGRGLTIFLGAWICAAAIGTAHQVHHFGSGVVAALGNSIFLSLLGAFVGPLVGLLSGAPYFTWQFKVSLASALSVAIGLFLIGVRGQASWWRRAVGIAGVLLWMIAGLLGFGPQ